MIIFRDKVDLIIPEKSKILTLKNGRLVDFDFRGWLRDNELALKDAKNSGAALRVKILASASGLFINSRVYPGPEWKKAAHTFAEKPILKHHDDYSDAIGRIIDGNFEQLVADSVLEQDYLNPGVQGEKDPTGLVWVRASITDPLAIQQLTDKRLLHTSQGSGASAVHCSICAKNKFAESCDHEFGREYEIGEKDNKKAPKQKRLAYPIIRGLRGREVSFVNGPAFEASRAVEIEATDSCNDSQLALINTLNDASKDTLFDDIESFELVDYRGKALNISVVNDSNYDISTSSSNQSTEDSDIQTSDDTRSESQMTEIEKLRNEATEKDARVAELQSKIRELETKLAAKEAEASDSKRSLDALQVEYEKAISRERKSLIDAYVGKLTYLDEKGKEAKRKDLENHDVASLRFVVAQLDEVVDKMKPSTPVIVPGNTPGAPEEKPVQAAGKEKSKRKITG